MGLLLRLGLKRRLRVAIQSVQTPLYGRAWEQGQGWIGLTMLSLDRAYYAIFRSGSLCYRCRLFWEGAVECRHQPPAPPPPPSPSVCKGGNQDYVQLHSLHLARAQDCSDPLGTVARRGSTSQVARRGSTSQVARRGWHTGGGALPIMLLRENSCSHPELRHGPSTSSGEGPSTSSGEGPSTSSGEGGPWERAGLKPCIGRTESHIARLEGSHGMPGLRCRFHESPIVPYSIYTHSL